MLCMTMHLFTVYQHVIYYFKLYDILCNSQ